MAQTTQTTCDSCQKPVNQGEYMVRPSAIDKMNGNGLDSYSRQRISTLSGIARRRLCYGSHDDCMEREDRLLKKFVSDGGVRMDVGSLPFNHFTDEYPDVCTLFGIGKEGKDVYGCPSIFATPSVNNMHFVNGNTVDFPMCRVYAAETMKPRKKRGFFGRTSMEQKEVNMEERGDFSSPEQEDEDGDGDGDHDDM